MANSRGALDLSKLKMFSGSVEDGAESSAMPGSVGEEHEGGLERERALHPLRFSANFFARVEGSKQGNLRTSADGLTRASNPVGATKLFSLMFDRGMFESRHRADANTKLVSSPR
jgi:hypothetical protein